MFCPLSDEELRSLAAGEALRELDAHAVTPGFRNTFGFGDADDEEAERTAMYVAGLAGLLANRRRLVAVAETNATDRAGDLGEVLIDELRFNRVTALFADDPANTQVVSDAGATLTGMGLSQAWDAPEHEHLLQIIDMLWHGPEEWPALVAD